MRNLNLALSRVFDRDIGRPIAYLVMIIVAIAWLLLLNGLMIVDVWDETTARLFFSSEPATNMGTFELLRLTWSHELAVDIYRPLGSSLFIVFNKLFDGNFVVLRYINALLVLGSICVLSYVLLKRNKVSEIRVLLFFCLMLFSSAAFMTSSWFANIYDASCLFFISLAIAFYYQRAMVFCGISISLAVFCKESYVLAFPLLVLLLFEDEEIDFEAVSWIVVSVFLMSLYYWINRQLLIPIGSAADIHSFDLSLAGISFLSYLGGFAFQHVKFDTGSALLWIGLLMCATLIFSARTAKSRLMIATTILASAAIYWGMISFQGESIITAHNFVARLYLIPLILVFFVLCREANPTVLILFAILGSWGAFATYQDHKIFQETYLQIYDLALTTDGQLRVHYPERTVDEYQRHILIGDYPEAEWEIDVVAGGLRKRTN